MSEEKTGEVILEHEETKTEAFKNSITDDEVEVIKERRAFKETMIDDEEAKMLAILSDSTYDGFCDKRDKALTNLRSVLLYKKNIDKNKVDIMKGSTERRFKDGSVMDLNDLEMENILASTNLSAYMANLRKALSYMYRYIGMKKLDGTDIIVKEEWKSFVSDIQKQLKRVNLDLFKEKPV